MAEFVPPDGVRLVYGLEGAGPPLVLHGARDVTRARGALRWDSLRHVSAPALFVVGELEDPSDDTAEGAALMPRGARVGVAGQGHIGAFIRSDLVLPDVTRFLAEHA